MVEYSDPCGNEYIIHDNYNVHVASSIYMYSRGFTIENTADISWQTPESVLMTFPHKNSLLSIYVPGLSYVTHPSTKVAYQSKYQTDQAFLLNRV